MNSTPDTCPYCNDERTHGDCQVTCRLGDVTGYSIGPFTVDTNEGTVHLEPGVYTIRAPLEFGLLSGKLRLENLDWQPLLNLNSDGAISERAAKTTVTSYEEMSDREIGAHNGQGPKPEAAERWNPASDPVDAMSIEEQIEKLGEQMGYIFALKEIVQVRHLSISAQVQWKLLRATPRQRCIAALTAIEASEEKGK